ncbi:MAG: hypothetical protein EZS28_037017, partial [Streblomastix strix]
QLESHGSFRFQTTKDLTQLQRKNEVVRIHHKDLTQKTPRTFEEQHPECTEQSVSYDIGNDTRVIISFEKQNPQQENETVATREFVESVTGNEQLGVAVGAAVQQATGSKFIGKVARGITIPSNQSVQQDPKRQTLRLNEDQQQEIAQQIANSTAVIQSTAPERHITTGRRNLYYVDEQEQIVPEGDYDNCLDNDKMANINVEAAKFIIDTLFKGRAVIRGPNKPFILGVNDLINLIAILTAMPRETVEIDVDENQIERRGCFGNDRKKLIDIEDIKVNERSLLVYDNVLHNCIEKLYRVSIRMIRF